MEREFIRRGIRKCARCSSRPRSRMYLPDWPRPRTHYPDWPILDWAAIHNTPYMSGLSDETFALPNVEPVMSPRELLDRTLRVTRVDDDDDDIDTPPPSPTPDNSEQASPRGPIHSIPPILLLPSEVIDVSSEPEIRTDAGDNYIVRHPIPVFHEKLIISGPQIVVPPYLVTVTIGNRTFKVILRRVLSSGELLWDVRLYAGRNRNPPDWEPVRHPYDSSSEDSDSDSDY